MKILHSSVHYDKYDPKLGESFEYCAFYKTLSVMDGVRFDYFPFDRIPEIGKAKWNQELLEKIKKDRPDVFFAFMYSDEFEPGVLEEIKKYTTSVAWFADDSWRFYNYSRRWAKHFSWAVTTYSYMPPLYKKAGQPNVIRSQWGVDIKRYRPLEGRGPVPDDERPDVTFIGGWSGPRARIVDALKKAGVPVRTFGGGWPDAQRVSEAEMIRLFSTSKINLALNPAPGLWTANSLGRLFFRPSFGRVVPDLHLRENLETWLHQGVRQVKARHFEIPACGGFTITAMADDLDRYYEKDKEMVYYDGSIKDLVRKIKYYLAHPEEREKIREAGYRRAVREHTYEKRFMDIFKIIMAAAQNGQ